MVRVIIGLAVLLVLSQLGRMASRRWPRAGFVAGAIFSCAVFGGAVWLALLLEADVETGTWLTEHQPLAFWFWAGVTLIYCCVRGIRGAFKIRAAQREGKDIDAWAAGTFLYFLPLVVAVIFYID